MSTDNLHDDAEFARFMAGEDDLSRQLKALPQAEPSAELDAAVFASIEAAMAAEKVQLVEPEPRPAANDSVGPPSASPRKKRSMAWYWHLPVGVAAGILAVFAYRTGFEQHAPAPDVPVALLQAPAKVAAPPHDFFGDPIVSKRTVAPPAVASQAVAPSPAVPEVSMPPAPVAAMISQQSPRAESFVKEVPKAQAPVETITVTGIRASLQKSLTQKRDAQNDVQVIVSEDVGKMPDKNVADSLERVPGINVSGSSDESGVELAWTHDPAQDVHAGKRAAMQDAPESPPAVAMAAPPPQPAPVMAAPPPVAAAIASLPPTYNRAEETGIIAPVTAASPSPGAASQPADVASTYKNVSQDEARRGETAGVSIQQPRQAATDEAHADPRKWLSLIEREMKGKNNEAALAEWDKFVAAHPGYPVKPALRARIKALRAAVAKPGAAKPEIQPQAQPSSGK